MLRVMRGGMAVPRGSRGFAAAASPTKVTTLSNNMRVATEYYPGQTATVGVWIESGTRFETEENNGTAHFLEHMAFKGTKRRTRRDLELEVENMGAHLNAYTSREQTVYYAKIFKEDTAQAVDILSDILLNSNLSEVDITTEQQVILREELEVSNNHEEVTFDRLHSMAYQGTPLDKLILGSREQITKIGKKHLQDYIQDHYKASRCVLVGAGAIDHEELVEMAEKYFESMPTESPLTVKKMIETNPTIFTGSEVRNREDDMPLAHVAFAFEGPSWTHGDSVPMMVLASLFGSWDRTSMYGNNVMSRMCARAAELKGTHKVSTFNTIYSDTSLFGVYYVAEPKDIDDLQWALQYEMTRACFKLEEEQLERAKATLKNTLVLGLDDTSNVAEDIGRQLLVYGRRVPLSELFARIDAVDEATIMRVANEYLFDREMAISSMGPVGYLPDYNWMRRRTYWNRF